MRKLAVGIALAALAVFVFVQDAEACKKGGCLSSCYKPCHTSCGKCYTPCHAPCGGCQPCAPAAPSCAPCSGGACKSCAAATTGDCAVLVVELPADAQLKIQDVLTSSTSSRRVFQSPTLEKGKEYIYTLKATAIRNGKTVELVREVTVRAGSQVNVNLDLDPVVASAK
ncbi:MAG: TIGR03000 domain-containing protein [Gemmatales bacterium]|nr:TIGR03000 domain-containing protein [Gemmatales bacterium]MDW8385589.1 TIGR03000 domain-containing protein [Gemmatales bacterium]